MLEVSRGNKFAFLYSIKDWTFFLFLLLERSHCKPLAVLILARKSSIEYFVSSKSVEAEGGKTGIRKSILSSKGAVSFFQ